MMVGRAEAIPQSRHLRSQTSAACSSFECLFSSCSEGNRRMSRFKIVVNATKARSDVTNVAFLGICKPPPLPPLPPPPSPSPPPPPPPLSSPSCVPPSPPPPSSVFSLLFLPLPPPPLLLWCLSTSPPHLPLLPLSYSIRPHIPPSSLSPPSLLRDFFLDLILHPPSCIYRLYLPIASRPLIHPPFTAPPPSTTLSPRLHPPCAPSQ